jgi:pilus assembly protein CpaE
MTETKINVILIGDNQQSLEKQQAILLSLADCNCKIICSKTIIDAISKQTQVEQSIVIINLTANGSQELQFLNALSDKKAAIIIIGDHDNVGLLGLAIRAGVKDFIDAKNYEDQLNTVFCNVKKSITYQYGNNNVKRLNAIINAKGGSGASFIASNIAYVLSKEAQLKVALLDLDAQFGSIGLNFDKTPKYTLTEALAAIDDLDAMSLEAYMVKYTDALSLLMPSPTEILLPGEMDVKALQKMLDLLKTQYSQIIVDLPRLIDPVSSIVMEQANQITLVLQQSLAQFRDGRRLIQILNKDLDMPLEKIAIVVNRYDPKNSLRIEDLKSIVHHEQVYTISNDYERVASASNLGVPLCESSPHSKIAQELKELAKNLGQLEFEAPKKKSFNIFGWF